jgi:hypothetical protein
MGQNVWSPRALELSGLCINLFKQALSDPRRAVSDTMIATVIDLAGPDVSILSV